MYNQFGFEKLEVWQLARKLAKDIYSLTALFPSIEKYGLSNQLQRAAISIPSNIAEGSGRSGNRDKIRFIEIAYGSLIEVVNQLYIAKDLGYINDSDIAECIESSHRIAAMLSSLRNTLLSNQ